MDMNTPNALDVYTTIIVKKKDVKQQQEIEIPVEGGSVKARLPEKVASGSTYVYAGQGRQDAEGNRGSLYVTIQVQGKSKRAKRWILAIVVLLVIGLIAAAVLFGGELMDLFGVHWEGGIRDYFAPVVTTPLDETTLPTAAIEETAVEPTQTEETEAAATEAIETEATEATEAAETETTETVVTPETEASEPEPQAAETETTEPVAETEAPAAEPTAPKDAAPKNAVPVVKTEPETEAPCEHEWKDATYVEPKTCALCGEIQGTALRLEIGDSLYLGSYTQREGKSVQPIEWIVLDKRDGCALLLSRYCLDTMPLLTEGTRTTWENSTLRSWLNDSFLNEAFTSRQQESILEVTLKNTPNVLFDTDGGADTQDKVFLLSLVEYYYYLSGSSVQDLLDGPTEYAIQNSDGALTDADDAFWWLRTPGKTRRFGASVGCGDGKVYSEDAVTCPDNTARPAIWVDIRTLG